MKNNRFLCVDTFRFWVRYEVVNAMLMNEFLEEDRNVEQQQATIARLKISYFAAVCTSSPACECSMYLSG
jgi:hypothetical protein